MDAGIRDECVSMHASVWVFTFFVFFFFFLSALPCLSLIVRCKQLQL